MRDFCKNDTGQFHTMDCIMAYQKGRCSIEDLKLDAQNAREFLNKIKLNEEINGWMNRNLQLKVFVKKSSYDLRTKILELCSPSMTTCEAYTKTCVVAEMSDPRYLRNPQNWVPERVREHAVLIQTFWIHVRQLSARLGSPVTIKGVIGNTGCGKSHAILNDEMFAAIRNDLGEVSGVLNPDVIKFALRKITIINGKKLSNPQVHQEGISLFIRFMYTLIYKFPNLSLVIDTRIKRTRNLEARLIHAAKIRNGKAQIVAIDGSLLRSINRVLCRRADEAAPRVLPEVIIEGFVVSKATLLEKVKIIESSRFVTDFKLYGSDTGQLQLVAEKKDGMLTVFSQKLFNEACRVPSQKEIDVKMQQKITPEYIENAVAIGDIDQRQRHLLERWLGHTVWEAAERHARNRLPQNDGNVS